MFITSIMRVVFFFFNDTATTEIYTLSLHDALPICRTEPHGLALAHKELRLQPLLQRSDLAADGALRQVQLGDRKSTRLNSSHGYISYAVFCLKKKTQPCRSRRLLF